MTLQRLLQRTLPVAAVAAIAMSAAPAQASTLTFDDLGGSLGNTGAVYGVQFQHTSADQYLLKGTDYLPSYGAGNFLGYYALTGAFETMVLTGVGHNTFALSSLDLIGAEYFVPNETGQITITGLRANGTSVTSAPLTVTAGQVASYGPAAFSAFTGLQSIRMSGVGNNRAVYVGLDNVNITITPVPEPETLAMLLAGLGLVGAAVRLRAGSAA
jgi:hypothetical protein